MKALKLTLLLVFLVAQTGCNPSTPPPPGVSTPTPASSLTEAPATEAVFPTATVIPTATRTVAPTAVLPPRRTATAAPIVTLPPTRSVAATASLIPTTPAAGGYHRTWTWQAPEMGLMAPAVATKDGAIFVTDWGGTLHALSARGEELWSQNISFEGASPPALSPQGDRVYVAGAPNRVVALDRAGAILWTYQTQRELATREIELPGGLFSRQLVSPLVAPTGEAYVRETEDGLENCIVRLSAQGRVQPFGLDHDTRPVSYQDTVTVTADGYLLVQGWDFINQMSLDGKPAFTCPLDPEAIPGSLLARPGGGFYQAVAGEVAAFDRECREMWRTEGLAQPVITPTSIPDPEAACDPNLPSNAAFSIFGANREAQYHLVERPDGVVIGAGPDQRIFAVAADGKLLWQTRVDAGAGDIVDLALDRRGNLFIYTHWGFLQAFDKNGRRTWIYELPAPGSPGPMHPNGSSGILIVQNGILQNFSDAPSTGGEPPEPAALPGSRAAVEEELLQFFLDLSMGTQLNPSDDYEIAEPGEPWELETERPALLVYAPPSECGAGDIFMVDTERAHAAWWVVDDTLYPAADPHRGINEYRQRYVENVNDPREAHWMTTEFGVVHLSADLRYAEVYYAYSCGPLCGAGMLFQLRRSPSGQWWLIGEQMLWIS